MKKIISSILVFLMVFSLFNISYADNDAKAEAISKKMIMFLAQCINEEKNPDGSYNFDNLDVVELSKKTGLDRAYVKTVIETLEEAYKLISDETFVKQIKIRSIADSIKPTNFKGTLAAYPTQSYVSIYVSMNGGRQRYSFVTHEDMEESYEYADDLTALTAFIALVVKGIPGTIAGVVSASIYTYGRYYEELDESGGYNGVVFLKDYDAGPGGFFDWAWSEYPYLNY